jgi:hypothetical protein
MSEEKIKIQCKKCGGLDHWFPRMPGADESDPDDWRCWVCNPTRNYALIAKRVGPLADAIREAKTTQGSQLAADASKRMVLSLEAPACALCKCSLVEEVPTNDGSVKTICWACRSEITPIEWKYFLYAKNKKIPYRRRPAPPGRLCVLGGSKNGRSSDQSRKSTGVSQGSQAMLEF